MILLYLRTIPAVKISVTIFGGLHLFNGKVKKIWMMQSSMMILRTVSYRDISAVLCIGIDHCRQMGCGWYHTTSNGKTDSLWCSGIGRWWWKQRLWAALQIHHHSWRKAYHWMARQAIPCQRPGHLGRRSSDRVFWTRQWANYWCQGSG